MSLQDEIKKFGYWDVSIRPAQFETSRIEYSELEPIIHKNVVAIRGWDFPHVDRRQAPLRGIDWIGQDFSLGEYKEVWRFWQSGQFAFRSGFTVDWRLEIGPTHENNPFHAGDLLGVGDALAHYLEFVLFAQGLSVSLPGRDDIVLGISAVGLSDRVLDLDSPRRAPFHQRYSATIPAFPQVRTVKRDELAKDAPALAKELATSLFQRFGWTARPEILDGLLQELRWQG